MSGRASSPSESTHPELVFHSIVSTPNASAASRRSTGSTPVTCPAPAAFSACENSSPIDPWPITATRAPRTSPSRRTAYSTVHSGWMTVAWVGGSSSPAMQTSWARAVNRSASPR